MKRAAWRAFVALIFAYPITFAAPALQAADLEGEAPAWAQHSLPERIKPFVCKGGLPDPWPKTLHGPLAPGVAGLDRWQANHFVVYRKETAAFLYNQYTPTKVDYRKGSMPLLEQVAAEYTAPNQSDREKALALLTRAMCRLPHCTLPPRAKNMPTDRDLDDEALFKSGHAWCNEQARVYVRLCQIVGIPARMIYLFYADEVTGHVVVEFYDDSHWCMADSSWLCAFPDEHGRLLSAAQLHEPAGKKLAARIYAARTKEILALSDEQLALGDAAKVRKEFAERKPDGLGCFGVLNYPLPPAKIGPVTLLSGKADGDGDGLHITSKTAAVSTGDLPSRPCQFTAELRLAPQGGPVDIRIGAVESRSAKPTAGQVTFQRDKEGKSLRVALRRPGAAAGKRPDTNMVNYVYWPETAPPTPAKPAPAKPGKKNPAVEVERKLIEAGIHPRTWHDRWLPLWIDVAGGTARIWLDYRFLGIVDLPADAKGAIILQLAGGDKIRRVRIEPRDESLFLAVDLTPYANDRFSPAVGKSAIKAGGIQFRPPQGSQDQVNLRPAQWIEWQTDPAAYYENYDMGSPIAFDPRMTMLRVPAADYIAAHLLAVADDDPGLTSTLTLRAGSYGGGRDLVVQHDFSVQVPRHRELGKLKPGQVVATPAGRLAHVMLPLPRAIAQDLGGAMDIELTKEVRLAVRSPDPCRWRYRPLGLPSGVRIAAMVLEKAPLQMRVTSGEAGHAFVQPQTPTFQVLLDNITDAAQAYKLTALARHLDGTLSKTQAAGRVEPRKAAQVSIEVPVTKRGYFDLTVTLTDDRGRDLARQTSFALLPPDTRKHREGSPFGTWDFCGGHFTASDPDRLGPLYVKAGLRYGMFSFPPEVLKKYGVLRGTEPNVIGTLVKGGAGAQIYRRALERFSDTIPSALVFHETSISGDHNSRVPDLFHDRPPYQLNDKEKEQFDRMWQAAQTAAGEMRKEFPKVKIALGNGPLTVKEEMLRHKFPADLFDSAGNESGSFGRPPEAQPPDTVAGNASIWMDRQMLDAYGYSDKPITQCYEICYPSTNPGNLSPATQADYFIRHSIHALAWDIPIIRFGVICDVGNSYYYGNWGASGLCCRQPELNVKPAFVAVATMTRMLDGAKFRRVVDLGSPSLFGVEFERPHGLHALVMWTIRGHRTVRLKLAGAADSSLQLIDDQANEATPTVRDGAVEVTLSPAPIYLLSGAKIVVAEPGTPRYAEKPTGRVAVLSALASLDDWTVEKGHNAQLEHYNFMTPRRLGNFAFEPVPPAGGGAKVLQVTPRPIDAGKDTMPMYAVLAHKKGLPVPGTPREIGLWVNGNSSWGRMIFELTDASGQRWISIGAPQAGSSGTWFDENIAPELRSKGQGKAVEDWNTNDVFGLSRIDFDGWRYVAFPLPGNYPGEKYHWPMNSQWFHDKDGVVHYPLVLKKLIVELPSKTLHVKDFASAPRPEIQLKDLTVASPQ